jgi:HTH-type transcriptional regulator / antitoxin HigA
MEGRTMSSKVASSFGGHRDRYFELVRQFPLRPLRTSRDLTAATKMVDSLVDRGRLKRDEQDYLDVLTDIVERHEREHHRIARVGDHEMLRHLIEAKRVTQSHVAKATGISESTISSVLAGRRKLNRRHIGKLCRFFGVEPGVFSPEA